jgi:hypothetical protein
MTASRAWIVGFVVVASCTYDASKLKPPATASADGAADQRLGSSDGMLGTGGAGDAPVTSLTDAGQRDAAGGGGAGGYGGAGGAGGMAGVGGTVGRDAPGVGDANRSGGAGGGSTSVNPPLAARQVDLLVMIDNSPSMAPKVNKMNQQFTKLIAALKNPSDGTLPDLRVAIIDSDLGTAGAYQSGSCGPKTLPDGGNSSYGDLGRFQMLTTPSACTFNAGAQFLEYKSGAPLSYSGDINMVFACLATNLGTMGCGVEHQLQAFEFALAAKGVGNEAQQQAFLRGDALLGLVFLTDEDDCSAATNDGMFGDKPELRTESASLRCATRAHMCGGRNLTEGAPGYPTTASFETAFSDCKARTDDCPNQTDGNAATDTSVPTTCSPLKSVRRLATEIKALKRDPANQIVVAGIFGWPLDDAAMASAKYKVAPIPNPNTADVQHMTVYDYWPVCYDSDHQPTAPDTVTGFDTAAAMWGATGGLRESAFIDEFGANGLRFSICQRDFTATMAAIGNAIAQKLPAGGGSGGAGGAGGTGGIRGVGGTTGTGGIAGRGGAGGSGGVAGSGGRGGSGGGAGSGGRGGSGGTTVASTKNTGNTVNFDIKGKASGAMTGYGWVMLGKLDSITDPTCGPSKTPITASAACASDPNWSGTGLCITGGCPALPASPTSTDYADNFGVVVGVNAGDAGGTGDPSLVLGQTFTSITITATGLPTTEVRAQIHKKGDSDSNLYCMKFTSGTAMDLTRFATDCYNTAPTGLFKAADIPNIDKVSLEAVSVSGTAVTVTNMCMTGITFK